ncbi:alpha/beta fold hydrolase [Luteolibacter ambystomatis]|uniref:Alpha/beta fold hydrolase n=1 Tax=Luteolibacter ambystomatis TaxID=2824561 RepID=A0A975PFB8_9BACT|nr:alpha/beta fold hydrolase [Luteolibacter ambystomatis]QUE51805.1 alpha/beta fold hydrolase [Luteolibacter ambystomatis]
MKDGAHWVKETRTRPERFEVTAADGITLSALVIEASPQVSKLGTCYLFHGFGNSKEQMLPTAKELSAAGFRCVAWDSRGHGKSGGERATYGTHEVDDALRVIAASRRMDHGPRGMETIWAYSMGTAVALQTLPSWPEAKAAVLLAPIADLEGILRYQAEKRYHGAMTALLPVVRSSVRHAAGFDPRSIRPVDAVKHTDAKLLFIHGSDDGTVPPVQSERLLDACRPGQGKRIVLPRLGHGSVMWDLPDVTKKEAITFLANEAQKKAHRPAAIR